MSGIAVYWLWRGQYRCRETEDRKQFKGFFCILQDEVVFIGDYAGNGGEGGMVTFGYDSST